MSNETPQSPQEYRESDAQTRRNHQIATGRAALEANTEPIPITVKDEDTQPIPVPVNITERDIAGKIHRHGNALTNVNPMAIEKFSQKHWLNQLPYGVNRPRQQR